MGLWQVLAQFRTSGGYTTFAQLSTAFPKPTIVYGLVDWMVGNDVPMWIAWVMTGMSSVLPVLGSLVCGVWHIMQRSTPLREPPWNASWSWHVLQSGVRTTSRGAGVPPAGTKSNVVEA